MYLKKQPEMVLLPIGRLERLLSLRERVGNAIQGEEH